MIARKLDINADLRSADRLLAVRDTIESLSNWVLVLDDADDLTLFSGAGRPGQKRGKLQYLCAIAP